MSKIENTNDVQELIARSVFQNRTVRAADSEALRADLSAAADGEVAGEEREYWGTYRCAAGNAEWRIHLV